MWEISTSQSTPLSFGIPIFMLYLVSANKQEMSHFRLPAEHTTKASAIIKCQNQTLLPSLYHKQQ